MSDIDTDFPEALVEELTDLASTALADGWKRKRFHDFIDNYVDMAWETAEELTERAPPPDACTAEEYEELVRQQSAEEAANDTLAWDDDNT